MGKSKKMKNIEYKGYKGYFYEEKYEEVLKKIIDKNLISANTNKNFPVKTCGLCKLIK